MAKNVENVYERIEEVLKNSIQGKRKAFKKEEIQKQTNTASQLSSSTQPKQD